MATRPEEIPSFRLYGESESDPADFWLHCETIPVRTRPHNWEIALHRHESFFQLFLLTVGHGEIVTAGGVESFISPTILFVPPDAAHGFRFSRDIDGRVVTALADRLRGLAAADRSIEAFVQSLRVVPVAGDGEDARLAREAIERLHEEFEGRRPARALLLEPLMTTALVTLARAARADPPDASAHPDRMEALQTLVDTHFRERPPARFYAGRLGISTTHLNRLVRKSTDMTLQAMLDRRTLEVARRDLLFTPGSVQQIAYALGFADPAYFNRFFRRQTGLTPGAYRRRERSRLSP